MCKETCRYFKGFAVNFFLKSMFLFWPYLGLETCKWNDSNWRIILRPVVVNIQKTTRSNYGTMSPEFGIHFQFLIRGARRWSGINKIYKPISSYCRSNATAV